MEFDLIVLIHGANAKNALWHSEEGNFRDGICKAFPKVVVCDFKWGNDIAGGYNEKQLREGSRQLISFINNGYAKKKLLLIAHSFGGLLVGLASAHSTLSNSTVVTLGTSYYADDPTCWMNTNIIPKHYHLYSMGDIQQDLLDCRQILKLKKNQYNVEIKYGTHKPSHQELVDDDIIAENMKDIIMLTDTCNEGGNIGIKLKRNKDNVTYRVTIKEETGCSCYNPMKECRLL
jgi:hypothetical protein